jgi:arylsulfatase A-like enzyme
LLTFAIGIKPLAEVEPPGGATKLGFRVRIGEDEPNQVVFQREIHRARSGEWLEQAVELHRFAGREVWLSFESTTAGNDGRETDVESGGLGFVGLFAEPVLHDRARYRLGRAVVLISIDTLRRDHVSVYGSRRKTTPGLENLASEAIVFDDAVSTSSWTLPAHASLFTSLYPSFHGAVDLHRGLSSNLLGLPHLLNESGFFTQAMVTHLYLSRQYGFGRGFDRHLYLPETRAKQVTDRAIKFLKAKGDEDFFLFLHYYDPHWHYDPPPPYDRTFDPTYEGSANGIWWDFKDQTLETIDPRDLHHIKALYDGEILYTDRHLERLFRAMKQIGVFDKAVVVVTSDHGEEFLDHGRWEHQKTLYEEQIRVPLLLKLPEGKYRGRRVQEQVSLIDVAPTISDIIGLPIPTSFQGRNLLRFLAEVPPEDPADSETWSETEHTVDGSHKVSLRKGSRGPKLIFSLRERDEDALVELYDLDRDPQESGNLIDSPPLSIETEQGRLQDFLSDALEMREAEPALPIELTTEQLDKLRALGYVR